MRTATLRAFPAVAAPARACVIRRVACQLEGFLYDLRRLRQPEGRTRQQLPAAVLLLPDLQDADLGVGNFAIEFAFRHPQMTHYSVVANDRDCEVWKIKRLEDILSRHDRVDEFGLVF